MLRTDVINALISRHGLNRYLEIGVQNPMKNFDRIKCAYKVGVDPDPRSGATFHMTSDQFFKVNEGTFDIIFIDGLHESDQVSRDIENSLDVLHPYGYIVMHDCNPTTERMQRVPRIQKEWTGDTWKSFVKLRRRQELLMYVVDTDYGVGVITRGTQKPLIVEDLTYERFDKNRKEWLNLITVEQFYETGRIPAATT